MSWRAAINRPAVDDRLKQIVVEIIGMRIDGTCTLALIAKFRAHLRIQEVCAGNKFSEKTEAGRVIFLQLGDEGCGDLPLRRSQKPLQTSREIRTESQNLIETFA